MVYKYHPVELKECALWVLAQGYLSEDEITEMFGCSKRSLRRWFKNLGEHGDVVPEPSGMRGRPRLLTANQMNEVLAATNSNPAMLLEEIQDWIALNCELMMDISTVQHNIEDCLYTYKYLQKTAAEHNEVARAAYIAQVHSLLCADMVIAIDETSKDERTIYRRYGRALRGLAPNICAQFV